MWVCVCGCVCVQVMEKLLLMAGASLVVVQALHQHQHQHHVATAHHHLQHTLNSAHAAAPPPPFSGSHSFPAEEKGEETCVEQHVLLPALEAKNLNAASVVKSATECFTTEAECTRDVSDPGDVDLLLTKQEQVLTRQEHDQEASEQEQEATDDPIPAPVHVRAQLGCSTGAEGVAGGKGGTTRRDMVDVSYSEGADESTVPQMQVGSPVVETNVITKPDSKVFAFSKVA
jgi:hypothetical protein